LNITSIFVYCNLEEYRYFLIAGTPAIGKSNLAAKLLGLGMAVSDLDLVRDIMKQIHRL
jgi:broad-specificity NMP kinase